MVFMLFIYKIKLIKNAMFNVAFDVLVNKFSVWYPSQLKLHSLDPHPYEFFLHPSCINIQLSQSNLEVPSLQKEC